MEQKISNFWTWFLTNEKNFYELNPDNSIMLIEKISKRLSRVNRDLTSHFSASLIDGKREYIISANGDKNLFPLVFEIIEKAPKLPQWDFKALKPRIPVNETMGVAQYGEQFQVKDIYFQYQLNENGKVDIVLYFKKEKEITQNLIEGTYHILDYLLGEYDVETKLGIIDFQPYKASKSPLNLNRLTTLPDIVDEKTIH